MPLQWVGDLSIEDAYLLQENSYYNRILEFGCGGSTIIFSQGESEVTSVETDQGWIDLTKERLSVLGTENQVTFKAYEEDWGDNYDLVFVDGIDQLRLEFAIKAWNLIGPRGGTMVFHDTRRFQDFKNAMWVAQLYFEEVHSIDVNRRESNLTFIYKRSKPLGYENWNETEGKPKWAYGIPDGVERTRLWTQEDLK